VAKTTLPTTTADLVVGFMFSTQAGFSDATFGALAGAYEDTPQDMCSWPGVVSLLKDAHVGHGAVHVGKAYAVVSLEELESKVNNGVKGAYVVRVPGTARDDFQIKIHDAVIAQVWDALEKQPKLTHTMWLGQEAAMDAERMDGDATSVDRRRALAPNTSSPTMAPTKPKDYIRMVPELFTGLLLFVFLILSALTHSRNRSAPIMNPYALYFLGTNHLHITHSIDHVLLLLPGMY
jgi:hypothetical protein